MIESDSDRKSLSSSVHMMVSDPGIICFQHCGPKVFCIDFPEQCPSCTGDLGAAAHFKLMPFRLPFPFIKASQYPCSVVLRPTNGDFLNDYMNSKDLHIGVTTSTGAIVEFDRHGLRRHSNKEAQITWAQSLLVEQVPEAWFDHWDTVLGDVCQQDTWETTSYREENNNCYSFVLTFLHRLNYGVLSNTAKNKTLFCEKYIVPRTTAAGKYISLYRKIRDQGMYLHANSKGHHQQTGGPTTTTTTTQVGASQSTGTTAATTTTVLPPVTLRLGGADRKGAAGNSSSFNINSKLCSIRE